MVEANAWKKNRGIENKDRCRLCGNKRETVQRLLAVCNKLAGKEYIERYNNTLMVFEVHYCIGEKVMV